MRHLMAFVRLQTRLSRGEQRAKQLKEDWSDELLLRASARTCRCHWSGLLSSAWTGHSTIGRRGTVGVSHFVTALPRTSSISSRAGVRRCDTGRFPWRKLT